MKRTIIIIALIALFGWAIYDSVIKKNIGEKEQAENNTGAKITATERVESGDDEDDGEELIVGLEPGNIAPDFQLENLDGETVNLSDYRGQKVMLNFWATWCPPCRAEMPDMQKFHEDTDIVILAVNLTETSMERNNIPKFMDEYGITFPILLDEELEVSRLYRIKPIPTTYLINTEGIVHNVAFGALNYDLMIHEYELMQ